MQALSFRCDAKIFTLRLIAFFLSLGVGLGAIGASQGLAQTAEKPLTFDIWVNSPIGPISPLIYGVNNVSLNDPKAQGLTTRRVSGNRYSGYNWETNFSNAGADYRYQNDAYLSNSAEPGAPVLEIIDETLKKGGFALVTVPMIDHVAADKKGDEDIAYKKTGRMVDGKDEVVLSPDWVKTRLIPNRPVRGSAFPDTPDLNDGAVYQDEWINWLKTKRPNAFKGAISRVWFSLDNEPDLWQSTHPRLLGVSEKKAPQLRYKEIMARSSDYAEMIKANAPNSLVFGPVSYGWNGMRNFQGAPDADKRDFLDTYLKHMKAEEKRVGKRLLDVLDVHWYPEDRTPEDKDGKTKEIKNEDTSPEVVALRLQAPRSLWDPKFIEPSWIGKWNGAVQLIPRMKDKIRVNYPGTALGITEYFYGGAKHISGGIAQADVLGIFGREGVFVAHLWPYGKELDYTLAGFAMYRNYDGKGAKFGDLALKATTTDPVMTSIYAASDEGSQTGRLTLVVINKKPEPQTASLSLKGPVKYNSLKTYSLTSASPKPVFVGEQDISEAKGSISLTLPAHSVLTLELLP